MLLVLWKDAKNTMGRACEQKGFVLRIRKKIKFLGQIMRKDDLENLIPTQHTDGKKCRWKQKATYLMSLCKWMTKQGLGEIVSGQTLVRTIKYKLCGEP